MTQSETTKVYLEWDGLKLWIFAKWVGIQAGEIIPLIWFRDSDSKTRRSP